MKRAAYHYRSRFPRLKVRHRMTFFILYALIMVIGGIIITTLYYDSRVSLLQQRVESRQFEIIQSNAEMIYSQLDLFAEEYAFWDDMYLNVSAANEQWIQDTMVGSLENFESHQLWIFKPNGELLFTSSLLTPPLALPIAPYRLQELATTKTVKRFFSWEDGSLISFRAAPITRHSRGLNPDEQVAGYLIVAKRWDETVYRQLNNLLDGSLTVVEGSAPEHQPPVTAEPHQAIITTSLDQLVDWEGKVVAHYNISFSNLAVATIHEFAQVVTLTGSTIAIILIIVGYLVFFHWFISPLQKLALKLNSANSQHQTPDTLSNSNEFFILDQLVDKYLAQSQLIKISNQQLQQELQQTKKLSQAIVASSDAIVITDSQGVIEYVNPAWEKLTGYAQEEVIGKNPRIVKSEKTPQEIHQRLWQTITSGKSFSTKEIKNRRKDGSEFDAFLSVYPVMEKEKVKFFVGVQHDISLENEVDRMKSEFISLASHQLRTPLAAIRWFTELLQQNSNPQHPLSAEQLKMISTVHGSTLRMIDLVNNLLNIHRIESGRIIIQPKFTQVTELIESIIMEFGEQISKRQLKIKKVFPSASRPVMVDPGLVSEIFVNLISNAIKYSTNGGTITIELQLHSNTIFSRITDTGVGIPDREREQVFSKFYRASNVHKLETEGTGLGLYLTKAIVEACGGQIDYDSTINQGSTFWFSIPDMTDKAKDGEVCITSSLDLERTLT